MERIINCILALVIIFGFFQNAHSDTTINNLPYTISSSGIYNIGSDLTIGSGVGITIKANNVTLQGAGGKRKITYAKSGSGKAIEINGGRSDITIKNLELIQSGAYDASYAFYGSSASSKINVQNCIVNIKSSGSKCGTAFRVEIESNDSSSHIQYCTINITGSGRFYGVHQSDNGPWNIHHNTFKVYNYSLNGTYPYVVYADTNMKVYENTFNISGEKVNVVASYGADRVEVYNNVFFYNSKNGGRIIFPDGGAEHWEIHDNEITITSNTSEAQYGIRVRGIDGRSSNYNLIYNNSIDASAASGPIEVISLGGGSATSHHNHVYNNYLKGNSNIINWYGLSDSGDFYCNTIIHTAKDGGYPINLRDNPVEDTSFWSNNITTERSDQKLVYSKLSNSSVVFCSNDISTDDMAGSTLSVNSNVCGTCDNAVVTGEPSSSPPDNEPDVSVDVPMHLRVVGYN